METIANLFNLLRSRPQDDLKLSREVEKREVIEKLAQAIVARKLEAPAVLFLELNRPLGFIFSQAAFFARPFLGFFLPVKDIEAAAEVLDDPKALDDLLARIDEISAAEAN